MKVVINKKYSGLSLSEKALIKYLELKGKKAFIYYGLTQWNKDGDYERFWTKTKSKINQEFECFTADLGEEFDEDVYDDNGKHIFLTDYIERTDKDLVAVIEELGGKANSEYSMFRIVEIPDDVKFTVESGDYGGEWIEEEHREWY